MANTKLLRSRSLFVPALAATFAVFLSGCGGPGLIDRIGNFWSYGFCSALVVVLDVIALLEVWRGERTNGDKILWTLIIVFFPLLGCIAYYFFGRK